MLAVSYADGTIRVFDADTGAEEFTLNNRQDLAETESPRGEGEEDALVRAYYLYFYFSTLFSCFFLFLFHLVQIQKYFKVIKHELKDIMLLSFYLDLLPVQLPAQY